MAKELGARVDALLAPYMNRPFLGTYLEDGKKLLLELNAVQKELRLIKQEISINERSIYARYTNERIDVRTGAVVNRFASGWLGLFARAGTASNRASIQRQQQQELLPYLNLRNWIDQKIIEIDQIKLDVQRNMIKLPSKTNVAAVSIHSISSNPTVPRLSDAEHTYFAISGRWSKSHITNLKLISSLLGNPSADQSTESILEEVSTYISDLRRTNEEVFACIPPPRLANIHSQRVQVANHYERWLGYRIRSFETKRKADSYHAAGLSNQDPTLLTLAADEYDKTTELVTLGTNELNQVTQITLKITEQIQAFQK